MQALRKVIVGNDGYHYTAGYFTSNKWLSNDEIILARSKKSDIGQNEPCVQMIKYSISSNSVEVLCEDLSEWGNYVVFENKIYYVTDSAIRVIDVESGENNVIYKSYSGVPGSPHITNDGRFISLFSCKPDKPTEVFRLDTSSGELKKCFEKSFPKPFDIANHVMISPTDENVFFFAHEGHTSYISNRLWIYDMTKNAMKNIAGQRLNDNGELEDCFGHEMWTHDGKGLYFVKYYLSLSSPKGIAYVDFDSGKAEVLYSAFNYWHVGVSCDGRYLTADALIPGPNCQIVLIDTQIGSEQLIDIAPSSKSHPCHPHPMLSPDNKKIAYTSLDDLGNTCVRIALLG